jgi:hypothetical protein
MVTCSNPLQESLRVDWKFHLDIGAGTMQLALDQGTHVSTSKVTLRMAAESKDWM